MTGLPTGTVTFLFTDIEGSTRLLSEIGDEAYGGVLERERRIVVDAAAANGGATFGSEGDAHFVAFGSAVRAIRAAVAAQEGLAAEPWEHGEVRVRMGIHTGEAQVVGEDYVGLEVHRAARIAAAGHGGQVLVSDATRSLVAGALPETLALRDLGEHRLKDLSRPERLWQVDAPGRPSSFAPLRTVDLTPNNLPPQLTSFVGRAEVAEGVRLLLAGRLLTLTGPGGTGKTRLSLALATEALPAYPGGAWFVPLASVTDPELVPSSIATAVGLLALNRSPLERILEHFGERTALIVLDNFEQVVAAAPIVADLLRGAPRLTVLVSSRAPLRIAGEQEFPVPPLSLPAAGESDPDRLMASEAVRLFLERAMAVRPDFALGADNGAAVAEIVRRLDGLPLAIELAAARVRILSPGAMVARLTDRLGLLSAGGRDLPERQRTLRGAIGWSHDLLDADARRLFARLAVFASGGPLDTVEAVCGSDGGGSADLDVLAGLEALAEQSLLRIGDDAHGDPRFTMLETIREYALERLGELGEGDALRDRHGRAYLELAQAAAGHLHGDDRGPDLDRLEEDHDNLRAAIEDAIARGDCERASGFLSALFRFWHMRGHLVEARSRAAAVLAMDGWGEMPSVARLRALEIAGGLAYWAGDLSDASGHYAAAEAEARRLGDEREIANALYNRFFSSRPTSGLDDWIDALAHENRRFVEEALAIYRRLGDESGLARCLWALGESDMYRRDTEGAERNTTESLEIFERLGDGFGAAYAHFTRGVARQLDGNAAGAGEDFAAALRVFRTAGDVSGISIVLSAMSSTLIAAGRDLEAHRMGGAASRWVAETGTHLATLFPEDWFPAPAAGSPDPELRAAWTTGARLGREESIDEGLRLAESIAGMPRAPA